MPTESSAPEPNRHSRRNFLAKLTLGVAALTAAASPLARLARGGKRRASDWDQELPGPDSIFHPAQDPRRNKLT